MCEELGEKENDRTLVGLWFHSRYESGEIKWQGQIVRELKDGSCVCQLYSWLMGDPTMCKLVKREDVEQFEFYQDDAAMREQAAIEGLGDFD